MTDPTAHNDPRPLLAIISGHLTPYRIHFHRRIVREIPEIRLATVVTRFRTGAWLNTHVPEIGTVLLDDTPEPPGGRSRAALIGHDAHTSGKLMAWLNEHRPAAIVAGGYDELPYIRALLWTRRRRIPSFIWADSNAHGDRATGIKRVVKDLYVPWITRGLSAMLVCGTMGRKFYHRYGVSDDRMFIVPVEPDFAPIENSTDAGADRVLAELGLDPMRRRLVVCCRLVPEKRVDLAIDAFAKIASERPDWDMVIAGDGPERAALESRVPADLARAGRVRFLGFCGGETVAGLYRKSQALVLPSDYEPWALVVIEAAVSGMALIVSDRVGAAYELVRNGENGTMFPAGDEPALVRALLEVTGARRAEEMGRASRTIVEAWRGQSDPVAGLRRALAHAGVL